MASGRNEPIIATQVSQTLLLVELLKKKMKKQKFSYSRWANDVAAKILESDLSSGFEVANDTPDESKAKEAILKLIDQLRRKANP